MPGGKGGKNVVFDDDYDCDDYDDDDDYDVDEADVEDVPGDFVAHDGSGKPGSRATAPEAPHSEGDELLSQLIPGFSSLQACQVAAVALLFAVQTAFWL